MPTQEQADEAYKTGIALGLIEPPKPPDSEKLAALQKRLNDLEAERLFAAARGSATYRLLNRSDAMCPGDERLLDDCKTWEVIEPTNPHIGQRYDGNLFVPMRRRSQNAGTQRPGTPDGPLATETRKPGSLK